MKARKKLRKQDNPEFRIQSAIIKMLRLKGWYVKRMPGGMFLSGVPDLYATHKVYGARWVEVKRPNMEGSRFTAAQVKEFPKLISHGAGVWVLTAATEVEYRKLFKTCNLWKYLEVMK